MKIGVFRDDIKMGKEQKLHTALSKGRTLSRAQVKSQFKLRNPSAAILRFVESGEDVKRQYTTKKVKGNYITTVKYSFA
jgi:hypothetical protein